VPPLRFRANSGHLEKWRSPISVDARLFQSIKTPAEAFAAVDHLPFGRWSGSGTFTPEYETHWEKLMGAYDEFMRAVYRYSSEPKWRPVKQKLKLLRNEVERCDAFLSGTLNEEDSALLAYFLQHRAYPFIEYWQGVIDTVESGRDLTINSADIPIWFDPEP
jgi:hypothetical protein